MSVIIKTIDELKPFANNARTHSEEQIEEIAASIKEFGFNNPVLIDGDNGVIAGHGRLMAARHLGMAVVPCLELRHLSETQKRAYILADNRLAEKAGWDFDLVSLELKDLLDADFDIGLTGFDAEFILTGETEGLTDPDAVPEPPETPVTVPGDIWTLGPHRLICGDATDPGVVEKLMDGQKADMVWTDPPYNLDYTGKQLTRLKMKGDNAKDSYFKQFLVDAFTSAYIHTKEGRPIYVAHADSEGENFRSALGLSGFLFKQCLVWVKNAMVLGRQDYQWQHEPILYGWKAGKGGHKWYGDFNKKTVIDDDVDVKKLDKRELITLINQFRNAKKTTVIREDRPHRSDLHPTMKPVALIKGMIFNSSRPEDCVLDMFGGSGSTLIACEVARRVCRLVELDPKYCDVTVQRWEEFTGQKAERL